MHSLCKYAYNPAMDVNQIIAELGGPSKVGGLCDISSQAVSQWKKNGIPKGHKNFLKSIRPDLFVERRLCELPDVSLGVEAA